MKKNNGFIKIIILLMILLLLIFVLGVLAINVFSDQIDLDENVENFSKDVANTIQTSVSDINNKISKDNTSNTSNPDLEKLINNLDKNNNLENNQGISSTSNIYFYYQLNDWSKIIYTDLYKNKENMKSGTYEVKISDKVSELLKKENGSELLQEYYQSAVEAYIYDNPDVFYLDVNKLYINIETTKKLFSTTYNVYLNQGKATNYLLDVYSSKEQIDECEKQIIETANKIISNNTGTPYQKAKGIHDYLIDNIKYDQTVSKNNIYNIYGALVQGECVCEGYAKAYKYLLDRAGIETTIVIGEAKNSQGNIESHAWNYIKLEDNWYAVDITWDDPIVIGGGKLSRKSKYKYFLKGYDVMNKDHTPVKHFTDNGMEFEYPILSQIDYD